MKSHSVDELLRHLDGVVTVDREIVTVRDEAALRDKIDGLIQTAVFSEGLVRDTARWLIWEIAQGLGIYPASIHQLYMAIGRGDVPTTFTVPAMNIRAMNYNSSRAVFRAANKHNVSAMLFEIARSEIGYTGQRPMEYTASILAAAIKEGYRGPVFIQGDHFQISLSRYKSTPDAEVQAVKDLMDEAVAAGFFNIDIDTSTLVDLSYATLDEQQTTNYTLCAELTRYVRSIEPEGITVSLGGEIGEVGHKNSTVEELHAFMQGYRRVLPDSAEGGVPGISKISVQTGTSHGGVVLPDGTLAQVKVDFETLRDLSRVARDDYGMGGAVQHGASTLPPSAFNKFPEIGTVEIHLATNFQNIVFDYLPREVVDEAYAYLRENHKDEWKAGKTDEQSLYSARKRAIGPFKAQWWNLEESKLAEIGGVLQEQFEFLFDQLNVKGTRDVVESVTTRVVIHQPKPAEAAEAVAAEDVKDLAD
ncbi:Ketose-bisphosphate aldolase class-II [Candidatus Promineifilum breve]|uniref:Ketose-bisphosphate aldolase class-II n=1 Tax=Candidatus Promineifilum breve TaxID=1806508 RepID=A0A160SZK5_9CHLR|nr:class II fructose-bisphosphate aldolase [Candidatus Promineifilum breve]CUS03021.2 Ketose-bisphosphate aldolase class-II [Candidatus Promineifilum breve]